MFPAPLMPIAARWCGLVLLLVSAAPAAEPDPAAIARLALEKLEKSERYAWELRDLDGEIDKKVIWAEPPRPEAGGGWSERPKPQKKRVRTLSPTIHGEHRPDGWAVTETGFAKKDKVVAVLHPSGTRAVWSERKAEWWTIGKFRNEFPRPDAMADFSEQMRYSSYWAAFTSPIPHLLVPKLLRDAERFRVEQDEIIVEVTVASARLLLGQDGGSRKLAPERFKGNARLRVRDGVLQECRIQLDYDVDLTLIDKPSAESIDILILFTTPAPEPPVVPEAARKELSGG